MNKNMNKNMSKNMSVLLAQSNLMGDERASMITFGGKT